ncbi:MAG: RnfABCDGE type electron transport complex subunit G [Bacteroidales bacterium]|nr:RnfABCDGE type electron transport complex subunit G [Bacteroidales bacterium]
MAVKSSFRNMVLCLSAVCLVCSALLAGVYVLTKDAIDNANSEKLAKAIEAVAPEFDSMSSKQTISCEGKDYPYYVLYSGDEAVAFAITSSVVGFGGPLTLLVGVTMEGTVYNTSVFSHAETPGLGAKCTEPQFHDQFAGWNPAEKTLAVRKDGGDVDAITASTITSRAYTLAVANAVKVAMLIAAGADACEDACCSAGEAECDSSCANAGDSSSDDKTNEEGGQNNE